MARGMLTNEIKAKAKELLGIEITVRELRLLPYLQHCLLNGHIIDIRKVNRDELETITKWQNAGHITGTLPMFSVTKQFWDAMCEIIWLSYADEV